MVYILIHGMQPPWCGLGIGHIIMATGKFTEHYKQPYSFKHYVKKPSY